jgi:predicted PurR-regulated permease PerM
MSDRNQQQAIARGAIVIAAIVIIIAGIREASAILIPFLLAVFIAVIGGPSAFWLKRKGVPSSLAVLAVVLVILGIGTGMGAVLSTSLNGFYQQMDSYKASLNQQMDTLFTWLKGMGIHLDWGLLKEVINPGEAMQLVATLLAGFGGVLTNAFLITLTVVFILLEASGFPAKLRAAMKDPKASFPAFEQFTHAVKSYLVIKTVVSLATGVAAALWVFLLGLDFPLLWGLLAFLFNYVPTIGSILAAVPAVLLALIQLGPFPALLVAVGYLCINFAFGSVIEPRFMGRGLGLSTLVVFLSLVFWGWVLGPVGMLLSVPLTVTAKIGLGSSEETRWLAILLGSEKSAKPAMASVAVETRTPEKEPGPTPASPEVSSSPR